MPTPTPTATSLPVAQQFPELQGISDGVTALLQTLGITLLASVIAIIALIALTSFGNEHRHALVRAAALSLLIGFAVLINADRISGIIQRLFKH